MSDTPIAPRYDTRRIVAAFLLSPLIVIGTIMALLFVWSLIAGLLNGAFIAGSITWIIFIGGATLIVTYVHELVLALPLFLIFKNRFDASALICSCFGFAVGFLPIQILYIVNDEHRLESQLVCGLIGAAIGYVFWRIGIKPRPLAIPPVDSK